MHSHKHSLTRSRTLFQPISRTLSYALLSKHSPGHSHKHTRTHSHTYSLIHSPSLSRAYLSDFALSNQILSRSHHTPSLSHTHSHAFSLLLTLPHTLRRRTLTRTFLAACAYGTCRMPPEQHAHATCTYTHTHTHTCTRACINDTHATRTRKRHIMPTKCHLLFATCTRRSRDTHACSFCTYTCHMPHPPAHDTYHTRIYGTACYTRTCHLRHLRTWHAHARTRTWHMAHGGTHTRRMPHAHMAHATCHLHMHIRTCTRACHMAYDKYTCHTSARRTSTWRMMPTCHLPHAYMAHITCRIHVHMMPK
jgi:hypothetical protein